MPKKKSNSSKLNGSSEIFANFLRELTEEAAGKSCRENSGKKSREHSYSYNGINKRNPRRTQKRQ